MIEFVIPLQPITKKNSQQLIVCRGRAMIIPSKAYKNYEKECAKFMPKIETIDYPVNVKATYYMGTRRKCDLTNLHEALHDVLVRYKVVADDNFTIIATTDGSTVEYDKENPRTVVRIEKKFLNNSES